MATPAPASACTLEGAELLARMHAWQRVASRATSRGIEDSRIVSTYPHDPQLLQELRDLIDAEATCCPFLEFNLEVKADSILTELRFSQETPAAMRSLIIELLRGNE
jgi:hypothetical protein